MQAWIEAFVARLAHTEVGPGVNNFYGYADSANEVRRRNLRLYLAQMAALRPFLMLIGEAPGYRGCRLTGVPFTSPAIIREGISRWGLFGEQAGFVVPNQGPQREATATMMWDVLGNGRILPLLWNVFPFHPHKPQKPTSNRAPTRSEIKIGEPLLRELLARFGPKQIVAVGNQAHKALSDWDISHVCVRHPSHGGKKAFAAGVEQIQNLQKVKYDRVSESQSKTVGSIDT